MRIKHIETKRYVIELSQDEDLRYVVTYKRTTMKTQAEYSFSDLKTASIVFDTELIVLEGH